MIKNYLLIILSSYILHFPGNSMAAEEGTSWKEQLIALQSLVNAVGNATQSEQVSRQFIEPFYYENPSLEEIKLRSVVFNALIAKYPYGKEGYIKGGHPARELIFRLAIRLCDIRDLVSLPPNQQSEALEIKIACVAQSVFFCNLYLTRYPDMHYIFASYPSGTTMEELQRLEANAIIAQGQMDAQIFLSEIRPMLKKLFEHPAAQSDRSGSLQAMRLMSMLDSDIKLKETPIIP